MLFFFIFYNFFYWDRLVEKWSRLNPSTFSPSAIVFTLFLSVTLLRNQSCCGRRVKGWDALHPLITSAANTLDSSWSAVFPRLGYKVLMHPVMLYLWLSLLKVSRSRCGCVSLYKSFSGALQFFLKSQAHK